MSSKASGIEANVNDLIHKIESFAMNSVVNKAVNAINIAFDDRIDEAKQLGYKNYTKDLKDAKKAVISAVRDLSK